jgi:hypothetical protein
VSALGGKVSPKPWATRKPNLTPISPFICQTTAHFDTCFCPCNGDRNHLNPWKRPSHHRSCSSLRDHIFLMHRDTMRYRQSVVTTAFFILSVRIIGSFHQFFDFFSAFSTMLIIFKQQNDSLESITFDTLIKSHFFTAMDFIASCIFQFFRRCI